LGIYEIGGAVIVPDYRLVQVRIVIDNSASKASRGSSIIMDFNWWSIMASHILLELG
jgi:hypothetical protein